MDYVSTNKKLWNAKTPVHFESDFYDVNSFIAGKGSLNSIESDLLGDIRGQSVLHLQCHFGMDTISLARRGAVATGVDLSDVAISKARELNHAVDANARFIESDVYSLDKELDEQFDVVFTSYGVVGWLPDMDRWAKTVAKFLKPGGRFIMAEFHPVVWIFSDDFKKIEYSYTDPTPIIEELEGTYTDRKADIKNRSISWNHGLAPVLGGLMRNGLTLTHFQELDYSPYDCFEHTIEVEVGKYQIRGLERKIPMVYSVVGVKPL